MSGEVWRYSHLIDDADLEILQKDFITYYEGADYYGLGLKIFTRMAHEAGAIYKIGKMVRVKHELFDEYMRLHSKI